MEQDKTCRIGGGLTAQYKHSENFLRVDIIVNKSAIDDMKPGTRWQPMPLRKITRCRSKVWEKSPFVNASRVHFPRYALAVTSFVFVFLENP